MGTEFSYKPTGHIRTTEIPEILCSFSSVPPGKRQASALK